MGYDSFSLKKPNPSANGTHSILELEWHRGPSALAINGRIPKGRGHVRVAFILHPSEIIELADLFREDGIRKTDDECGRAFYRWHQKQHELARSLNDPRTVWCPTCRAAVGSPCMRPSRHAVFGGGFHAPRLKELARKQAAS